MKKYNVEFKTADVDVMSTTLCPVKKWPVRKVIVIGRKASEIKHWF